MKLRQLLATGTVVAMAGAVLGLAADGETTVPADDIATSFPGFVAAMRGLGAEIAVEG